MEYSVSQALDKLKLLDKRIQKEIDYLRSVGLVKGESKIVFNNMNVAEFTEKTQSSLQKIVDLMENRSKINVAIMISNATTKVKLDGVEMTVIEAITQKQTIEYKKDLLNKLRKDYKYYNDEVNNQNNIVDSKLQVLLQSQFGNKDKESPDVKKIVEPYLEINAYKLIDPLNIVQLIQTLDSEIDTFESNISYVLSESNALTKINV